MKTFSQSITPIQFVRLLLVMLAGLLLCSCGAVEEASAAATSATAGQQQAGTPAAQTTARYDCLTTPNGIPRKVIVKKKNVVAYELPDLSGDQKKLKFFRKYFIFEESATGYRVGDGTVEKSRIGWVAKEDVQPWDSEQAIFFINKKAAGRVPVRVWMSPDDIGNAKKPHFTEQLNRKETSEPFPILEKSGNKVQVAFLWTQGGDHQALPMPGSDGGIFKGEGTDPNPKGKSLPGGVMDKVKEQIKRMDIVLVMDVTKSMGPYMRKVRQQLTDIVDRLSRMTEDGELMPVHIGVVAYRDYLDEEQTFMTKTLPLTRDRAEVVRFLNKLQPHSVGKSVNEAVFDGIAEAVYAMEWGDHSYRVLALVGDAPPHRKDDRDTRWLVEHNQPPGSEFFDKQFDENVKDIRQLLTEHHIQFYALGVGNNREMKQDFELLAQQANGRFQLLANAREFIKGLEQGLIANVSNRDEIIKVAKSALDDPHYELDAQDEEKLLAVGLTNEQIEAMRNNLIQEGWFEPDLEHSATVAVYVRRQELDAWGEQLQRDLLHYKQKEPDILAGILGRYAAGVKVTTIGEATRIAEDLAYGPDVLRLPNLTVDERVKVTGLRKKLNNIQKLLTMDKLFNHYEEGWVPLALLPGSLSGL